MTFTIEKELRVLICGDRNFTNYDLIKRFINSLPNNSIIIEGEAKGADSIARDCAEQRGLKILKFPAEWDKYGKGAGPIRNLQMIEEGKPNFTIAYHNDIKNSKGTKNMVIQAKKANIPAYLNSTDWKLIEYKLEDEIELEGR